MPTARCSSSAESAKLKGQRPKSEGRGNREVRKTRSEPGFPRLVFSALLCPSSLLLCSFLFAPHSARAEWHSYTNANYVNHIARVDSSFVIATKGGLVLFDPGRVSTLRKIVNTDGLPVNDCLSAAADADGNCWVGTAGGGLAVVPKDSGVATVYRPNDLPDRITEMVWDRERLLLGTDRGVYVIETRGTLLDFYDDQIRNYTVANRRELLSDRVLSLAVNNGYWIGTNQGVTAADYEFANWVGFRRPLGDSVGAIAFWHDTLLVATERGLALKESMGFRPVFTFAKPIRVADLAVLGNDVFVATDTGLFRGYGLSQGGFTLILNADARAVVPGETLWVGMGGNVQAGQGLTFMASGQGWSFLGLFGIASAQTSSFAFSPVTGSLHICHYLTFWGNRAVTEIDRGGAVRIRYSPLINPIGSACDSRGRVWFAHFANDGGLSVYDPGADTWGVLQWGPWSGWNVIDAFGIDRDDTKWVFNGDGVVVAVDSAGRQVEFDIPGLVPPPRGGFDFAFDSRGRVWLGLTVGLVKIDPKRTLFDRLDDEYAILTSGLPVSEARSVAVDNEDNVWIATPQGAAVWDGARFRVYTVGNSGILDNNVYRVRTDRSGRVWLLCQSGVSVYDRVAARWFNYTPQNSGLIKSTEGMTDFYTTLAIGPDQGVAAIGTQRGVSILRLAPDIDTMPGPHIFIYPNPCVLGVNEWVVVSGLPERASVEVRTLQGLLVTQLPVDEGMRRAVWRPGRVATGIYLVRVGTAAGMRVERVVLVGR